VTVKKKDPAVRVYGSLCKEVMCSSLRSEPYTRTAGSFYCSQNMPP